MQQYIIAALAISLIIIANAAYSLESQKTCVRGYGKTPAEAFAKGVKMAEHEDAMQGGGKKCLNASARIHILPEKINGLYVVEVYSLPHKGFCDLKPEYETAKLDQP